MRGDHSKLRYKTYDKITNRIWFLRKTRTATQLEDANFEIKMTICVSFLLVLKRSSGTANNVEWTHKKYFPSLSIRNLN